MERARIFELAPIKDMQKRGWLPETNKIDELSEHLARFFGVKSLDEPISFPLAMRKSDPLAELSPAQRAWCFRARHLAEALQIKPLERSRLEKLLPKLRKLAAYRNEASHVADVLADFGIRLVIVEPLPGAKIDGAVFWLSEDAPVVALSLRFDRHDAFWFTLMHECAHVIHGDSLSVDDNLGGEENPDIEECAPLLLKDEVERRADETAAAALVDPSELESFIRRIGPLYSQTRIVQFAHSVKMHPGIIVGQLQHRGELGYHAHRRMLTKVRSLVVETALTDGWGEMLEYEQE